MSFLVFLLGLFFPQQPSCNTNSSVLSWSDQFLFSLKLGMSFWMELIVEIPTHQLLMVDTFISSSRGNVNQYSSSHNHGSVEKWAPSRWVFFSTEIIFQWTMVVGERVLNGWVHFNRLSFRRMENRQRQPPTNGWPKICTTKIYQVHFMLLLPLHNTIC